MNDAIIGYRNLETLNFKRTHRSNTCIDNLTFSLNNQIFNHKHVCVFNFNQLS